jgi:phosphoribosylcarboxyaminoimidazole (NCAIR) mutase
MVGVIMGSPNDLPTMQAAVRRYYITFLVTLRGRQPCFGTPHTGEMNVAVAGGVARLPGMVADGHETY